MILFLQKDYDNKAYQQILVFRLVSQMLCSKQDLSSNQWISKLQKELCRIDIIEVPIHKAILLSEHLHLDKDLKYSCMYSIFLVWHHSFNEAILSFHYFLNTYLKNHINGGILDWDVIKQHDHILNINKLMVN